MSMQAQMAESPVGVACLEMMSGPDKGKVYDLLADRITIGRSENNDIMAVSDAVSRQHAILEKSADGRWSVRDNQSKNGISVNGVRVTEVWLRAGDVLQVGDFVFRFGDGAPSVAGDIPLEDPVPAMSEDVPAMEYEAPVAAPRRGGGSNRRVLIYGGVGLLLAFLYLSNNSSNNGERGDSGQQQEEKAPDQKLARDFEVTKKPDVVTPVKDPEKPIGREDPVLTDAEHAMSKVDLTNTPAMQAEQFFRRGLREYTNKNWERSIEDFRTSLTLNRAHESAQKYLAFAMHEAESQAKQHMENGVRYFESLQYERAIYDFRQVVELMQHRPSERIVSEAEKYIAICKQRLQQAELFP